jgi:peptide/nickel transport system permease protein
MARFIVYRLLMMIPTMFAISLVAFIIIQLPPGNYLTSYIANLAASGETVERDVIEALNERYGLDQPVYVQYFKWIGNVLQGRFGQSFEWRQPVENIIWSRMGMTVVITGAALLFTWAIAFPIGIYSAVRQYSLGDYVATTFGFLGLAIPNFLLGLVLMYIAFKHFGQSVGGLFSPELENAPWSFEKVMDLLAHLWIPMIILGTAGAAGLIRVMRANLLDELRKPYVITARAKGLPEWRVILKYPVRIALNPFVSTLGYVLPELVSGSVIVAVVLSLPISGPLLLRALMSQDMYLAGAFILLLSVLTVIGTLLSDLLLAWLDPRIRYA